MIQSFKYWLKDIRGCWELEPFKLLWRFLVLPITLPLMVVAHVALFIVWLSLSSVQIIAYGDWRSIPRFW